MQKVKLKLIERCDSRVYLFEGCKYRVTFDSANATNPKPTCTVSALQGPNCGRRIVFPAYLVGSKPSAKIFLMAYIGRQDLDQPPRGPSRLGGSISSIPIQGNRANAKTN